MNLVLYTLYFIWISYFILCTLYESRTLYFVLYMNLVLYTLYFIWISYFILCTLYESRTLYSVLYMNLVLYTLYFIWISYFILCTLYESPYTFMIIRWILLRMGKVSDTSLVYFQLDAQNFYLFIYNIFIKILYMFRALPCSSSGGLRRNCIHATSGIVTL